MNPAGEAIIDHHDLNPYSTSPERTHGQKESKDQVRMKKRKDEDRKVRKKPYGGTAEESRVEKKIEKRSTQKVSEKTPPKGPRSPKGTIAKNLTTKPPVPEVTAKTLMEEQARKDKEEKARKVKERAMQLKEVKVVKKLVAKPKGGAEGSQGSTPLGQVKEEEPDETSLAAKEAASTRQEEETKKEEGPSEGSTQKEEAPSEGTPGGKDPNTPCQLRGKVVEGMKEVDLNDSGAEQQMDAEGVESYYAAGLGTEDQADHEIWGGLL